MSTKRRNYKNYFRQDDTPKGIPRRTIFRRIRQQNLNEQFKEQQREHKASGCACNIVDEDEPLADQDMGQNDPDHSESSSESEIESENAKPYSLLFPNGKISLDESIRITYSFILRHKLSKSAISDLLVLLNFHLPKQVTIPTTPFLLEKAIEPDFSLATRCFYCPSCETLVETEREACDHCSTSLSRSDLLKSGKFFIQFNLRSSLKKLLEFDNVQAALMKSFCKRQSTRSSECLEDIMDGQKYQKLNLGTYDFTCSINTDGVSIFNSSKYSMWPVFISINELEYKIRRKYTLLIGLWLGSTKPNFDLFLRPFVNQCNDISENGLIWTSNDKRMVSKVFFPIIAADSVARCSLQGIKQFNGKYGCPWCLLKGETLYQEDRKHKWIFPPSSVIKRTNENFISHLRVLDNNLENDECNNCYGIKSASQFLLLKQFDIVDGFVFDYMHTSLLGIVRMFTSYWMDSKHHTQEFYIGTKIDLVSQLFCRVKIPSECNRVTRDLKDIAFWKANEWKSWMIMCIPILQDILKPAYVKHFAKFVHAMLLLTDNKIRRPDLHVARNLLVDFCFNAPNLYGQEVCTFNMHLLLHAVDCVQNWGPLWCYSLFQFEHNNGVLTSYFNGTREVGMQIVKKVILFQQLGALGTHDFKNEYAMAFFNSLTTNKKYRSKAVKCQNATLLGPGHKYTFNEREKHKLNMFGISGVSHGKSYKTIILKGKLYSAEKYNTRKHTNAIVKIEGNSYVLVKSILVNYNGGESCVAFVKKITYSPVQNINSLCKVTRISNCSKIFYVNDICNSKYLSLYSDDGKLLYFCECLNSIELE